jgi:hypothetical protein
MPQGKVSSIFRDDEVGYLYPVDLGHPVGLIVVHDHRPSPSFKQGIASSRHDCEQRETFYKVAIQRIGGGVCPVPRLGRRQFDRRDVGGNGFIL